MKNNIIDEINVKFIIFLTDLNLRKKTFCFFGRKLVDKLKNKGVYAVDFYEWKQFFSKNNLKIPKFDINDESPSHGVVYKKFTDKQYLNIHKYSNYQFQEQSRALTTLVGFLGAKKVEAKLINKENESMNIKNDLNLKDEVKVKLNIGHDKRKKNNEINITEFLPIIDEKFFYSSQKFHDCAKNDGLFGIDSEVYKQMKFQNIVSERYNGQLKSYYVIYKELYTKDSIEIGGYINKLNIGINSSVESIKEHTEIYTFIIEYYPMEDLKLKNYDRIIKNELLKNSIKENKYSKLSKKKTFRIIKSRKRKNKINNSGNSVGNRSDNSVENNSDNNIGNNSDSSVENSSDSSVENSSDNSENGNNNNSENSSDNSENGNNNNKNINSGIKINKIKTIKKNNIKKDNNNNLRNNNLRNEIYDEPCEKYNNVNNESKINILDNNNNNSEDLVSSIYLPILNSFCKTKIKSLPSLNNISTYAHDILLKNKNKKYAMNFLLNNDKKINDEEDTIVQNIIEECKLSKNMNVLKNYVTECIKKNGLEKDLEKWKSKDISNKLEDRCKWFECKYDIDNFLEKL